MATINIKVVAYGVPALLIILGFLLLAIGNTPYLMQTNLAQDGWDLIIIGVVFYAVEIIGLFFGIHA